MKYIFFAAYQLLYNYVVIEYCHVQNIWACRSLLITENMKAYCRNMGEVVYLFIKLTHGLKQINVLLSKNEFYCTVAKYY